MLIDGTMEEQDFMRSETLQEASCYMQEGAGEMLIHNHTMEESKNSSHLDESANKQIPQENASPPVDDRRTSRQMISIDDALTVKYH